MFLIAFSVQFINNNMSLEDQFLLREDPISRSKDPGEGVLRDTHSIDLSYRLTDGLVK